jgi:hypothetical protein
VHPDAGAPLSRDAAIPVPTFLLHHEHDAAECAVAVAAWRGFQSALRGGTALSGCARGDHAQWVACEAPDAAAALALLPPWVAARTTAHRVERTRLP